jgi:hypothetical protein
MNRILMITLAVVLSVVGLGAVVTNSANAKPEDKVVICHVPPGNPENAHTITVSENALKGHLDNNGKLHGLDYYGECKTDEPTDPTTEPTDNPTDPTETATPTDNPTTDTPTTDVPATPVTPIWSVDQSCSTPRDTWITATDTDAYTVNVYLSSGHAWEIEFVANEGYEFTNSDKYTVSDDKGRAVVTGRFLVVRCVVPHEPEIGTPEVETRCTPKKCVKITRDGSGKVIKRDVTDYGDDVVEEGL